METKYKVFLTLLGVIVLAFAFVSATKWISKTTGFSVSEDEQTAIAQCLTSKGATMYGLETCPHCQNQKELFSSAFRFINYVDCAQEPAACSALEGVPAWKINGQIQYGTQTLEQLAVLSGCA
ncbi:hypothetical protein HYZ97_02265 [Candidatus Pacearchaeota archaeon]|nr:hypothetical protein [Candidatus Pacearchaeota archaeon]